MKAVIICGGIGTKMWPESRSSSPKQFLPLIGEKSLFQLNWEALRVKFPPEEIFLQTNAQQAEMAKKQIKEILPENIFIEPEMKNQGPATGFAAASLINKGYGDEPFMLIQTDLLRTNGDLFLKSMEMAGDLAEKEDVYITGGMKPKQIVEGVDYIVKGELIREMSGIKLYRVADYIDRTEKEKIKEFMDSDKLLLHWNHTTMTPNNLLKMYEQYRPDWSGPLKKIANGESVTENYGLMPKGAIEEITAKVYRTGKAVVMEFPFEIWDFGTWESVAKYLLQKNLYVSDTKTIELDSTNNFVRANKTVALIGVSDLIIIDKEDALLICKKDKTGKVGEVVDKLKAENRVDLL
ncbi:MAG: sugar phosphate nucleotidyltransferase [Candidatus Shapirobacteria bacterium]